MANRVARAAVTLPLYLYIYEVISDLQLRDALIFIESLLHEEAKAARIHRLQ